MVKKKTKDLAYFVYSCYEYLKIIPLDIIKKVLLLLLSVSRDVKMQKKTAIESILV